MQLNPSEISELIKQRIGNFEGKADARNEGTIVSLSDGIVRIHGLNDAMSGEMISFSNGLYGLALNLERDSVGAVVLGDSEGLTEGDKVECTGRILEVPVGPELLGRVVNSLGEPIDGKGDIETIAHLTDREGGPRGHRAAVGQPAGADRPEVHRRDGPGRTWPARADHW